MSDFFRLIDQYTERVNASRYNKPHDLAYALLGAIDEHLAIAGRRALSHAQQKQIRAALIAAGKAQLLTETQS